MSSSRLFTWATRRPLRPLLSVAPRQGSPPAHHHTERFVSVEEVLEHVHTRLMRDPRRKNAAGGPGYLLRRSVYGHLVLAGAS